MKKNRDNPKKHSAFQQVYSSLKKSKVFGLSSKIKGGLANLLGEPFFKKVSGITAIPLIIALVLMISIGSFFMSLMTGMHLGAPLLSLTTKSIYISDTGIEFTSDYLAGVSDWSTVTDIASTTFGGGTFSVAFTNKTTNSVTAACTGLVGTSSRIITADFTKTGGVLASNPVNYLGGYTEGNNVTILCEDLTTCGPPPASCLCSNLTSTVNAPELPLPSGAPPLDPLWPNTVISGDCTFPADCGITPDPSGVYYFGDLQLNNNVDITVTGPVTIWIQGEFEMKNNSTFNYLGDPANVLVVLIDTPGGAEFELNQNAKFFGAVYAPSGEVELEENAEFTGAIVGNTVELNNNSMVTYDPTAGVDTSGYSEMSTVITPSGWAEL